MPDEPDPPRKFYGFKPREFESANFHPPAPSAPGATPVAPLSPPPGTGGKIDVRDLARLATPDGTLLSKTPTPGPENEIHTILRDNLARADAAGLHALGPLDDSKRCRRIRRYWLLLAVVDLPLGTFAFWIGHGAAIPFVFAVAGVAMFTSWLTWETFFLRTHY